MDENSEIVERLRRREESLVAARNRVQHLSTEQRENLEYEFKRAENEARVIVEYGAGSSLNQA
jgi:hypothetical protein